MNNCLENKCGCENACELVGKCVLKHELIGNNYFYIKEILVTDYNDVNKLRDIVQYFETQRPPKFHRREQREKSKKTLRIRMNAVISRMVKKGKLKSNSELIELKKAKSKLIPPSYVNIFNFSNKETLSAFLNTLSQEPEPNFHE